MGGMAAPPTAMMAAGILSIRFAAPRAPAPIPNSSSRPVGRPASKGGGNRGRKNEDHFSRRISESRSRMTVSTDMTGPSALRSVLRITQSHETARSSRHQAEEGIVTAGTKALEGPLATIMGLLGMSAVGNERRCRAADRRFRTPAENCRLVAARHGRIWFLALMPRVLAGNVLILRN